MQLVVGLSLLVTAPPACPARAGQAGHAGGGVVPAPICSHFICNEFKQQVSKKDLYICTYNLTVIISESWQDSP